MQSLWLGTWVQFWLGWRLAPFVPTPASVGRQMLRLAAVNSHDRVYDLGCGDGSLLIAAAQLHGAKGVGAELNQELVHRARARVAAAGVAHLVRVECQDALNLDLSEASVVLLYLSEAGNATLLPKLAAELAHGARVVSFCWRFPPHVAPSTVVKVHGIPILLYTGKDLKAARKDA